MRMSLSRAWVYNGHIYGPGDVDVPDAVGAALQKRGAVSMAATQNDAPPPDPEPPEPPPQDTVRLPDISEEVQTELRAAGYQSNHDVYIASDEDLLAVTGLGRGSLKRIRARQQREMPEKADG